MTFAADIIFYILLFVVLYIQVFLLVTLIESRKTGNIAQNNIEDKKRKKYPSVTVIVPCFNEEKSLAGTIFSLLKLEYPKDKLSIFIVDDGSRDGTLGIANKFAKKDKRIKVFHKENGGKYTALNLGLKHAQSEFVGCLDADSYVEKDALVKILAHFDEPRVMAVTPALKVHNPKRILEYVQQTEYIISIFLRKMFGTLQAIPITPGPFSIFRKEIFDIVGDYKHAHNTEDMEIAMRINANHYQIANCHSAYVHTIVPETLGKLYRQRLRWTYGFIRNTMDYRRLLFKREYGHIGMFTLPAGIVSIIAAVYYILYAALHFIQYFIDKFIIIFNIGFELLWPKVDLDWFYVHVNLSLIITLILVLGTIVFIFAGKRLAEERLKPSFSMIYFFALYGLIAPLWITRAVYNAIITGKVMWR